MDIQKIFKRYEIKYLITEEQLHLIQETMNPYMEEDAFGASSISNIYYDTPDFRLIRRSLERPVYKEKLRLRSYGTPGLSDDVFLEIKKKYQSVVYKRRTGTSFALAMRFMADRIPYENSQILREIAYFMEFYQTLEPKVFLSYDRKAYYSHTDYNFRITFDHNIQWRNYDLSLSCGPYGSPLLKDNQYLMEIKTTGAIPLWLTHLLTEACIYKTSFSKYGNAYRCMMQNTSVPYTAYSNQTVNIQGGINHAAINF